MTEIWKEYCEGVYISNCGRIVRESSNGRGLNPYIVSLTSDKGYKRIRINGKTLRVHRLVGELFIPNPDNKSTIDHIDRIRDNNIVSNLRWATSSEQNINRKYKEHKKYRKDNILSELCIRKKNNSYELRISRKNIKHDKTYKTLQEAIDKRKELLGY